MNLAQFIKEYGGVSTADVDSHIHAGLRSAPTSKSYERRFRAELARLQRARDETERRYAQAIANGTIKAPETTSRLERLKIIAAGHPDNEATKAARRLLKKHKEKAHGNGLKKY